MSFTEEQQTAIYGFTGFLLNSQRSPILRRPDEFDMEYQDIFFKSLDGTAIEGWFIPAKGSKKLLFCNHFMPGNRYGYPGHLSGYDGFGGFEVNFLPQYKALHEAGYNLIAYDLRNHGLSGDSNGRTITFGLHEARDVAAAIKFSKEWDVTKDMELGLLSICLGANSTLIAFEKFPEYFKDVRVMVALQPITIKRFIDKFVERTKLNYDDTFKAIDKKLLETKSFHIDDFQVIKYASNVKIPTKILQVKADFLTNVQDVQDIYDNLGTKEKELHWIEGTDRRFDGYNYLGKHPEVAIEWFDKHWN